MSRIERLEQTVITCKEVSTLFLSGQLESQSLWTRLKVRFHLAICWMCRLLKRQVEQMGTAAKGMDAASEPGADFEARLIDRISRR